MYQVVGKSGPSNSYSLYTHKGASTKYDMAPPN